MFTDWLAGDHDLKSPTWDALTQSLRPANLPEIADLLKFNHTVEMVSFTFTRRRVPKRILAGIGVCGACMFGSIHFQLK